MRYRIQPRLGVTQGHNKVLYDLFQFPFSFSTFFLDDFTNSLLDSGVHLCTQFTLFHHRSSLSLDHRLDPGVDDGLELRLDRKLEAGFWSGPGFGPDSWLDTEFESGLENSTCPSIFFLIADPGCFRACVRDCFRTFRIPLCFIVDPLYHLILDLIQDLIPKQVVPVTPPVLLFPRSSPRLPQGSFIRPTPIGRDLPTGPQDILPACSEHRYPHRRIRRERAHAFITLHFNLLFWIPE